MTSYHALFATCETPDGPITFRVGQAARSYTAALNRFGRMWDAGAIRRTGDGRPKIARVRHSRRWYNVMFMEVRATDKHGRGLGSERHLHAIPVPYRAAQRVAR